MPSAGGPAQSPLEQLLEVMTNKELYAQKIADHTRAKTEAEQAITALGEREAALEQKERSLAEREKAVARRETVADSREKQLAKIQEAERVKQMRWEQLLPQIAELIK